MRTQMLLCTLSNVPGWVAARQSLEMEGTAHSRRRTEAHGPSEPAGSKERIPNFLFRGVK
jgi:hypothetical protein